MSAPTGRVVGVGGCFIRAKTDATKLRQWYRDHLGIDATSPFGSMFKAPEDEKERKKAMTIWTIFDSSSDYFPVTQSVMFNYRVENLDRLLQQLKSEGVKVDEKTQVEPYGKFGWIYDPDDNKIELWEPFDKKPAESSNESASTTEPDAKKAKTTDTQK